MLVDTLYPEGVRHIVVNMRQKDAEEIFATQWTDDRNEFSDFVMRSGGFGYVLHSDDGDPIVACGAVPLWPGVWSIWMFATDRFDEIAKSTHRFAKEVFFPVLNDVGYVRLECRSMATHSVAHRWLESLGGIKEADVRSYGKNGEDFALYCWTKPKADAQSAMDVQPRIQHQ
jgi:hypothetical protein